MDVNIGIDDAARQEISGKLEELLADTYTLYLKSQNYHWNVTGPMFRTLHLMFEEHYVELRDAVDEVAERIRSLGYPAPGSYSEFTKLTSITEGDSSRSAMEMVTDLAEGHEATIQPLPSTGFSGRKISSRPRNTRAPSVPMMVKPLRLPAELLNVPLNETVKPSFG